MSDPSSLEQYNHDLSPQQQIHEQQLSLPHIKPMQQCHSKIKHIKFGYFSNPQWFIFVPTFIISILIVIMLWTKVFIVGWMMYLGRIMCIYVLYRYLSLAFSDPGLAYYENKPLPSEQDSSWSGMYNQNRLCRTCKVYRPRFMQHCEICNVCIRGHDHHCVFIGKCVGSGNIGQFRDFLCMIFTTLIFGIIAAIMIAPELNKNKLVQ